MNENMIIVIDFDSTFIKVEALEELAEISLKNNPQRQNIIEQIKSITDAAMQGELSFTVALEKRIQLLEAREEHLEGLIRRLRKKVSNSMIRNQKFFEKYAERVYIVSGGFKEFIIPIVTPMNILEEHVFANTFEFDENRRIIGFDESNILAQKDGKVALLKTLKLNGDVYVIGDGYTDYQIKAAGLANKFYAFTENIQRDFVVEKADYIIPSMDEFLYVHKLPMTISYPKNRIQALLLENLHPDAQAIFEEEGYQVEVLPYSPDEHELAERIREVSILGIRSKTKITPRVLKNANRLMSIGAFCIGTDQIDLKACLQKGVTVFNAPYSNTRSVVELTIGEIIILMRHIFEKCNKLKQGIWDKSVSGSYEIRGKKLGIVGYGNIGSQLSVLAEFLGMDVYYYDILDKLALGNAKKCQTMEQLLKKVDIVSIHVSGEARNENLIGMREFKMMKDSVIFLNLSRGFVVDTRALVKYLENGKIAGAAVDVYPREPKSNSERFVSELQQFENVILTPHIGGSTEEAQRNIADFVSRKVIDYVNTGNLSFSVNFPNLQLPELQKAHRLIHIHRNVPGMLAQINAVLAQHKINIDGQYLKTNEDIGYVITDINTSYNRDVIRDLKKIENTIKFRILY